MSTLKVGLIGAGSAARRHLDVLKSLPNVEVVGASSRSAERLKKLSSDYRISNTFLNNDEMLVTVKPDAVVIAVSAANTYDVASQCIKHDTSALIEKPPGLTAIQTAGLLEASKKVDGQFMVGLNRRFYGVIQNAKSVIEAAGKLVSVMVQYTEDLGAVGARNIHPPEVLEHWLAADAIHCIDLLRFFAGDAQEVHAMSSVWRDRAPNSYGALIRFKTGTIGHFISNWTSPGRWQAILYGFDVRVDVSPLEEARITRRDGSISDVPKDAMDAKFIPGFYGQDSYFLDHVRRNTPIERPAANLADALETMRLVEAIEAAQSVSLN
jgi:predicted dehydrogenase